ncbi:MAG: hypothetical protein XD93_0428 [candidate division WS6 bacterium 34_10]|uniref:Uncharacterized protein n=1 Tax=candidate division WS6 bacterium 34_10 TaxID=1641389 RepID=A0A101HI39_9BACT|nr:MAG: hypothetical protein XD93_0428 [candidate division WS6 bacterium 34_10]
MRLRKVYNYLTPFINSYPIDKQNKKEEKFAKATNMSRLQHC